MWPLILAAAVVGYGYYYWKSHGDASLAAVTSPNVVVKDDVQYVRPPTDEEKKTLDALMASYVASEPTKLTDGPLAGGAAILLVKMASPGNADANIAEAFKSVMKAGSMVGAKDANDARALLAVEQIDAIVSKSYPDQIRLYVASAATALQAAKAPSAYAILAE